VKYEKGPPKKLFILYWLKKTKAKNGKSAIYLRLTINKKRAELSTNLQVKSDVWDAQGQFVKGKTEEVKAINQRLTQIKAELNKKHLQLEALGKPITTEILKNLYLGVDENQKSLIEVCFNLCRSEKN
jgi:plasmid replication initiation protein